MERDYWNTEDGREERDKAQDQTRKGYTPCPCRDCMEIAIGPGYCQDCEEAGCQDRTRGECESPTAYGQSESD